MGRIPDDTIQAIRDRVDIVDLVGRYVSLKKAGRSYKALCPFHHEKTPSFTVSPERGTYHCFGCGEGGNALAFLMRHENLTFPEAARSLAAELGIEIEERGGADRSELEQVFRANSVAEALYRAALLSPEAKAVQTYLQERGIDRGLAERFGLGFAPDAWDSVRNALAQEDIPAAMGERAGLLKARERGGHYDLLRARLIFPIQDVRGRVVAFGGRALAKDQEPKYLNSPESPVFRKREAFYGFPGALEPMRRKDRVVVVEGYFDLIALHRAGIDETVATCGTALTEEHARNLRRRTRNVVLLFDGDEAGQRAALRALEVLLPRGLRVRAAALPEGCDPDDFLREHGAEALARLVDGAPPGLEIAIARAVAAGCSSPWERADAVAQVVPLLAAIPDPVERGEFARRLALAAGTESSDVEAAVRRAARGEQAEEPAPAPPRRLGLSDRRFADVLRILLEHPDHLAGTAHDELAALAPDDVWRSLAACLLAAQSGGKPANAAALVEQLEGESQKRFSALVAESRDELTDAEQARRVLDDTLSWLRHRQQRGEAQELTARLSQAGADPTAILIEKQRQLERRRQRGVASPGPASSGR